MTALAPAFDVPVPVSRRPVERGLAAVAVLLLVVLAVEGWAPRLLDRREAAPGRTEAEATAASVAAQRVSPIPGRPGAFEARDPAYRATFDQAGFAYLPAEAGEPLAVSLSAVVAGTTPLPLRPEAWTASDRVLERRVAAAVTERVTTRNGEVEWDVVLDGPLPGGGDLTVRGDLTGAERAEVRGDVVHVTLSGGGAVDLGQVVVLDAAGDELHRGLPVVEGGTVELRVPSSALAGARYPVVVDPTVSGPVVVDVETGDPHAPNIAYSGGSNGVELVVWHESVASQWDIYGAIVDPVTKQRTVAPFVISGSTEKHDELPDVAWAGGSFYVVWQHRYRTDDVDVFGQLVRPDGTLNGSTIGVANPVGNQGSPKIASNGTDFLVAWDDSRTGGSDVYARTATPGGGLGGVFIPVSVDAVGRTEVDTVPDVAWNGSGWRVVWRTDRTIAGSRSAVIETNSVSAGGVAGAANIDVFSRAAPGRVEKPVLAAGGNGQFLVAWEDHKPSPDFPNESWVPDIAARRLSSTGVPDPTVLQLSPVGDFSDTDPAVAYNGSYLVTWWDPRNFGASIDVYGARITNDGTVQDPNGFAVHRVNGEYAGNESAVTPGPNGQWDVAVSLGPSGPGPLFWKAVTK